MKYIMRFKKYIIALVFSMAILAFSPLNAEAATINLDNSSNRYFSVIGDYPSGYHYVYAYYLNSSVKSSLKPIALTYGSRGFYLILTKASQGTMAVYRFNNGLVAPDGTVDSVCTGSVDVSDVDISSSFTSLYDYLGGTSVDGTNSGISFRNYLISKGFSDSDQKKYLSDYKVFSVYSEPSPTEYRSSGCTVGLNGLLEVTAEQLYSQLKTAVDTGDDSGLFDQKDDSESGSDDYLPMLSYSLKRTTVIGFPSITQIKENLTWDYTEKEIYKDNPTKYNIEVWVSANWKKAPTGIGNIRDVSNMQFNDKAKVVIEPDISISKNLCSWKYSELGKKLYKEAGENWGDESGYNLFVRTYEVGGSKVSYWKVYNLALGGYVQQEDTLIDENGNKVSISDEDYDIGNTEHDGKNKDDQSSSAPPSSDSSTTAEDNPKSALYTDTGNYTIDSFLGSIKNVINTISGIPSLLASLASWLDPRLIALITASIALVISIGVVKMIL